MSSPYSDDFYASINAGSRDSARVLLPLLLDLMDVRSIADFGCGQGAWLEVWGELGVSDRLGLDGAYVDPATLFVPAECFRPVDLANAVDLGRRFDVVQSLEVAEHLPEAAAALFVQTLTDHADVVLFSAAVPGQGGTRHINEKPRRWWRALFAERGFVPVDPFRRQISKNRLVKAWYRYNAMLYVKGDALAEYPRMQRYVVPDGTPIQDVSPLAYKLRKVALARLPVAVIDLLALAKVKVLAGRAARRPPAG